MKVTKNTLKQIIKEEYNKLTEEQNAIIVPVAGRDRTIITHDSALAYAEDKSLIQSYINSDIRKLMVKFNASVKLSHSQFEILIPREFRPAYQKAVGFEFGSVFVTPYKSFPSDKLGFSVAVKNAKGKTKDVPLYSPELAQMAKELEQIVQFVLDLKDKKIKTVEV